MLIAPLMLSMAPGGGRPFADHRRVVEAVTWRYRTEAAWRDLPVESRAWQTAWKRHARLTKGGMWKRICAALLARADVGDWIDWVVGEIEVRRHR